MLTFARRHADSISEVDHSPEREYFLTHNYNHVLLDKINLYQLYLFPGSQDNQFLTIAHRILKPINEAIK